MKRCLLFISAVSICLSVFSQQQKVISPAGRKVNELLAKMTLEEKVGQMTQITLGVLNPKTDGKLDAAALKNAVINYKVGSILNAPDHALTVAQWNALLTEIANEANHTRLKIPVLYGLDAIHGQTYTSDAVLFPWT